jgi:hypothetical protein
LIAVLAVALGLSATGFARADEPKPNLFLVSAGVSAYNRPGLPPLQCAHKDAEDMAALFQAQQGRLFGQVQVNLKTNAQATAGDILAQMRRAQAQATAGSYTIVYLAGHGGAPAGSEYAYCAYDRNLTWTEIRHALRGTAGTVIVILDTCQAGSVTRDENLIVICGSLAYESGGEDPSPFGNGHFTKMFVRALNGAADLNGDGVVTLKEMSEYVTQRLHAFSNGMQHPQVNVPASASNQLPLVQVPATAPVVPVANVPAQAAVQSGS